MRGYKSWIIGVLISILFLLLCFLTLDRYGISWDEPTHFKRGQAYLHYFLTGEKNYDNLEVQNRSYFQSNKHNGEFWFGEPGRFGHPPVNGTIASFLNYIFYQKLGVLGDLESHHLFNILSASLLVFAVFMFTLENFGYFAAFVATLCVMTYPLFWSEAHFNIKDPAEAAFFAGTIWAFCRSLNKSSFGWLALSLVFFFFALGTKFNVLFLPLIIGPYLALRFFKERSSLRITKSFIRFLFFGTFSTFGLLILLWPALWENFPSNLPDVFKFYSEIGIGNVYQPESFYLLGFNLFPVQWILFTTPPLILVLGIVGTYYAIKNFHKYNYLPLLVLLWFIVPVLRISFPSTSVYGGIRQAMEFLPALAILASFGALTLASMFKKYDRAVKVVIVLAFIYPVLVLYKLHPNENVYFNSLIGGLQGAKTQNFPSWGNSYGNAYKQGVDWLNKNAEKGARVTLLQGELQNIYPPYLRQDLNLNKQNWSGERQEGEYIMELTFNDTAQAFPEMWNYVNNSLRPIYEVKVDGVAILKIWKNSPSQSKTD